MTVPVKMDRLTLRAWAVEWDHDWGRALQWHPEQGPGSYRLFRTRRECREYIELRYGYIRDMPDWPMPRAVRVVVSREP